MVARIGLQRLASQIRLVVSDAMQNKLSDPRLDRIGSVLRVEVSPELAFANVYISVMGTEGQQSSYIQALQGAHGKVQKLLARKLRTRTCPSLRFHLDQSLKQGMETIRLIDKAMAEQADGKNEQADPPETDSVHLEQRENGNSEAHR